VPGRKVAAGLSPVDVAFGFHRFVQGCDRHVPALLDALHLEAALIHVVASDCSYRPH